MDEKSIQDTVTSLRAKGSEDLLRLYEKGGHSDEGFEALRRLLTERNVPVPASIPGRLPTEGNVAIRPDLRRASLKRALRNMFVGAFVCIAGILVTTLTYKAAVSNPNGGSYIIAWGAILFGAFQFLLGVFQFQSLDKGDPYD
jgi:hypothetical protein